MQNGIHFISGLPRSGSTLLAALLRQNPRFHAEMSSPLCQMYGALDGAMSGRNEYHLFIDMEQRQAILRGLFDSYYARVHAARVVFDTNRVWCSRLAGLAELFPDCRVICCVRNLEWILDSFERLAQKNPFIHSKIYNFDASGNVYTRTDILTGSVGQVRVPLDGLRQAFYGEHASRLLIITYESLTRSPDTTLRRVYEFIAEPPFAHDFDNVAYAASAFDQSVNTPGLHDVAKRVAFVPRPSVLPPDLIKRFQSWNFWTDPRANPRRVQIV